MASAGARLEPEDSLSIRYTFHPEMNQAEIARLTARTALCSWGRYQLRG